MYSVSDRLSSSLFSTCLKNQGLCHFPSSFSWPGWQESTRFPVMTTAWSLENTRHSTNSLPLSLFTSRSKTCQWCNLLVVRLKTTEMVSLPQQFGPRCRLGNNPIWWTFCKGWFVSPRIPEIPMFHRTKAPHKKGPNFPFLSKLLLTHLPWPARKIYRCAKSISLYPINYWIETRIVYLEKSVFVRWGFDTCAHNKSTHC